MRHLVFCLLLLATPSLAEAPRNVVLFVADGLRAGMVSAATTPTMDALMARGVRFANPHAMFPTFTTANAASIATAHLPGDHGDVSNTIDAGFAVASAGGSRTPFLENDAVLGELDQHFDGDYLGSEVFLAAARAAGFATATIGKVGPALILDHQERSGRSGMVVDDQTGHEGGIPLAPALAARMVAAGIAAVAPGRGANGATGNATAAGTLVANRAQQDWFVAVATRAALPILKQNPRGFVMVFWSRDPDGTQHNQGDSLGRLRPGINGPTSLAAIRNADDDLAALLTGLKEEGLEASTDVIVTSDHGFSTITKESVTSAAARASYADVPAAQVPPGFLALDLAQGLGMPLFDPDRGNAAVPAGGHPSRGNGLLGDPQAPSVVVAANGGSDLIYLPARDGALLRRIVALLAAQDYTSGLFVDDDYGAVPGTLPLSAVGLLGAARTPRPAIAVNFTSFALGCADPTLCAAEFADTPLQQGQGMHGSFSRADTANAMGADGPDFRRGFIDPAPASNADLGATIAHVLGLRLNGGGALRGRVLGEALGVGAERPGADASLHETRSAPGTMGEVTVLRWQTLGTTRYFDAAGYVGRSVGIPGVER